MAKANAESKRTGATVKRGTNASGRRGGGSRVGKGEGLEVGNARREAGGGGPLPRAAAKRPRRRAGLQLPGEKAVKPTKRTVPVEPRRPAPGATEPLPAEALDQRRQVIGSADRRGPARR
jgi:hypothetical protein